MNGNRQPSGNRPSGTPKFRVVQGRGLNERRKAPRTKTSQSSTPNAPRRSLTGLQKAQPGIPLNSQDIHSTPTTIGSRLNIQDGANRKRSNPSPVHHSPITEAEKVSKSLFFLRSVIVRAVETDEGTPQGRHFYDENRRKFVVMIEKLLAGSMPYDEFIQKLTKSQPSSDSGVYAPLLKKTIKAITKSAAEGTINLTRIMLTNQTASTNVSPVPKESRQPSISRYSTKFPNIVEAINTSQFKFARQPGNTAVYSNPRPAQKTSQFSSEKGRKLTAEQHQWMSQVHSTKFFETFLQLYKSDYNSNHENIDYLLWSILHERETKMTVEECVQHLVKCAQTPLKAMVWFLRDALPYVRNELNIPQVNSPKIKSGESEPFGNSGLPHGTEDEKRSFQGDPYMNVQQEQIFAQGEIDQGLFENSDARDRYSTDVVGRKETETVELRLLDSIDLAGAFLHPEDIIQRIVHKLGTEVPIDDDVSLLISDATEHFLKQLLNEASNLAKHRLFPLHHNSNYTIVDNPKRFMESNGDVDDQHNNFPENRSSLNDQYRQIENIRFNDFESDSFSASSLRMPFKQRSEELVGLQVELRPKIIRVDICDLHAVARNNEFVSRSQLMHKFSLSGDRWRSHI